MEAKQNKAEVSIAYTKQKLQNLTPIALDKLFPCIECENEAQNTKIIVHKYLYNVWCWGFFCITGL
jgi:hypothetical protein